MFGVCCDELMLNPGVFFHYNDANVEGVKWQEKLLCFLTHKMSGAKELLNQHHLKWNAQALALA